jgi:hypothetical protein
MTRPGRGTPTVAIAALLLAALAASAGLAAPAPAAALSAWDGSLNLYRDGVFTTQKTWYYCTAADVQIIRNIVFREDDHSRAGQDRYFEYMRKHMRYDIPVKHGVDPAGWTAGMRRFVDDRYRLIREDRFKPLLRKAVRALRLTNLPIPLFVDHGNHGWVLHGFSATADPAVTSDFKVLTVRVTGPLWGRQNASYGYDMRPNKKLTRAQLRDFVTRWHYGPIRMVYEGEFLAIVPIPSATVAGSTVAETPTTTDEVAAGPSTDGTQPSSSDEDSSGAGAPGFPPGSVIGGDAESGTNGSSGSGPDGANASGPAMSTRPDDGAGLPVGLLLGLAILAGLTTLAVATTLANRRRLRRETASGPSPPRIGPPPRRSAAG